tara:strand:+ start:748 stop:960 length:213 start_codon:yes stop_codon:yes gene_type:complete
MNRTTQKQSILNDLKIGLTITPIDALTKHGCFRLAAVVFDLRQEGHNITTVARTKSDGKGKFASYKLKTT